MSTDLTVSGGRRRVSWLWLVLTLAGLVVLPSLWRRVASFGESSVRQEALSDQRARAKALVGGEVWIDEPDVLLVIWSWREVDELTAESTTALTQEGWEKIADLSEPGLTRLVFRRGRARMGFASGQSGAGPFVYYEDLRSSESHWLSGGERPSLIPPIPTP